MKKISTFAAVLLLGHFAFSLHAAPAEIYLLRHAEKLKSAEKDPALSPCGIAQAKAMATLLPAGVTPIYHSGYQRTMQTAQQLLQTQTAATLKAYDPGQLAALALHIQQQDQVVVVVRHSNTTPELIQLLSQRPAPPISEQDYGVLYQLKRSEQAYVLADFSIQQPAICIPSGS